MIKMNFVEYIKENPRKILENITSYLTIFVGILSFLIAYGTGFGINAETIAIIVTVSAGLNRVLTFIRVTFLKEKIEENKSENEKNIIANGDYEPKDDYSDGTIPESPIYNLNIEAKEDEIYPVESTEEGA